MLVPMVASGFRLIVAGLIGSFGVGGRNSRAAAATLGMSGFTPLKLLKASLNSSPTLAFFGTVTWGGADGGGGSLTGVLGFRDGWIGT